MHWLMVPLAHLLGAFMRMLASGDDMPVITDRVIVFCTRAQMAAFVDNDRPLRAAAALQGITKPEFEYCTVVDHIDDALTGNHPELMPGYPALIITTGDMRTKDTVAFTHDVGGLLMGIAADYDVQLVFTEPATSAA